VYLKLRYKIYVQHKFVMLWNLCILNTFQMLIPFNPLRPHTLFFTTLHLLQTVLTIVMVFYNSLQNLLFIFLPLIFVCIKFVA